MPPQPTLVTDVAIDASRRVAPPAAGDQPGAPITAEEPEPPIAAEQLEAPDQDADERTMRPTEGVEMPPDEDTEMPPDKDTEMPLTEAMRCPFCYGDLVQGLMLMMDRHAGCNGPSKSRQPGGIHHWGHCR